MPKLYTGDAKGADARFLSNARNKEHESLSISTKTFSDEELELAAPLVKKVAKILKKSVPRPNTYTEKLIRRNYYQLYIPEKDDLTDCMYTVISSFDPDISNNVPGGTGWTVNMYILLNKQFNKKNHIYLYVEKEKSWFKWFYKNQEWKKQSEIYFPDDWETYTGIGSREIGKRGFKNIDRLFDTD